MMIEFTSPFLPNTLATTTTSGGGTAMIILNTPLVEPLAILQHLWDTSTYHVCADGGANRLFESSPELIPNKIIGDLDSLQPHVKEYYASKQVDIERVACQDTNDLEKALLQICKLNDINDGNNNNKNNNNNNNGHYDQLQFSRIVVFGAFGGRLDQEMANIQILYKYGSMVGNNQIYLYNTETCAMLLPVGISQITMACHDCCSTIMSRNDNNNNNNSNKLQQQQQHGIQDGPTCGLIPTSGKCETVITKGFKWDLDGTIPLEFGGLVSTSNRMMQSTVTVETSHPLLFTAEVICSNDNVTESKR